MSLTFDVKLQYRKAILRLNRFLAWIKPSGLKPVLEDIADDQLDEHLQRFDVNKVDYLNRPLKGLMESYYRWKVRFTGIASQNIGILTGKMRSQTFTRVKDNIMYLENYVVDKKGRPYAQHFQKQRPIFGFSPQGKERALKICMKSLKKL